MVKLDHIRSREPFTVASDGAQDHTLQDMGGSESKEGSSPNHPMAVPSINPAAGTPRNRKKAEEARIEASPRVGDGSSSSSSSTAHSEQNSASKERRASRFAQTEVVNRSLSASGLKNLIAAGEAGAQGDGPGTPGAPSRGKRPLPGTDEDGHATIGKTLSSSSDAGGVSPFSGTVAKTSNDQWKIQVASRTLGEYGSSAGSLDVLTASGYRLPITSVDIHPSGQGIVVASMTGETHVYNLGPNGLFQQPQGESPASLRLAVQGVSVHVDGDMLATGAWDKQVRVLNARGREVALHGSHDAHVTAVQFSPDGRYLATGGGDKPFVRVWNVHSEAMDRQEEKGVDESGGGEGGSKEVLTELCINPGHWGPILSLSFSPVEETLASGSADGTIRLWDVSQAEPPADMGFAAATQRQNRTRLYHDSVSNVTFREMENDIVSDGSEQRYKWENPAFEGGVVRMCHVFDSDSCGRQNETRFQYVNSQSGEIIYTSTGWLRTLRGHSGKVNGITYSPNGELIASCGDDGTVRIWDAQSKRNIDMVLDDRFAPGTAGYHILSIEDEMSPGDDGPCSMKIDLDDEVIEFQVEFESQGHFYSHGSGHRPMLGRSLPCPAGWTDRNKNSLYKILRKKDGRVLFDWDASKLVMKGHQAPVRGVAFILDGLQVVSCAEDSKIRLWDVELGTCQAVINAPNPLSCLSLRINPPMLCLGDLAGCFHVVDGTLFDANLFVPDCDGSGRGAIGAKVPGSPLFKAKAKSSEMTPSITSDM